MKPSIESKRSWGRLIELLIIGFLRAHAFGLETIELRRYKYNIEYAQPDTYYGYQENPNLQINNNSIIDKACASALVSQTEVISKH